MSEPLAYATPRDERPPASVATARGNFVASLVPPVVGLAILALCYQFGNGLEALGLVWLFVGGGLTLATALIGLIGLVGTFSRSGDVRRARYYFAGSMLMLWASLAAAGFCIRSATYLENHPLFRVSVENRTPTRVEVTLHFVDGDVTVGPVPPHRTAWSGRMRTRQAARAPDKTVTAGGQSRRTQASAFDGEYVGDWYTVPVDPADLPAPIPATRP